MTATGQAARPQTFWSRPVPRPWGPVLGAAALLALGALPAGWHLGGLTSDVRGWLYAACAATALLQLVEAKDLRAAVQCVVAAGTHALLLGPLLTLPFVAFAGVVVWLSLRPGRAAWRPWLVPALWLGPALTYWLTPLGALGPREVLFAALWAAQLYAGLLLVVEAGRGLPVGTPWQRAHSLLLVARVTEPFFQPLSPTDLRAREAPPWTWPTLASAPALWGLGQALGWWARSGAAASTLAGAPVALQPVVSLAWGYAQYASAIFTAVGVLRLMGWHLRSGFDRPFVARSFADFFRRWNFYVRGAVLSVFYGPVAHRLRHWPPRYTRAAAAFLSIFLGSFLLNELLVPVATSKTPGAAALEHLGHTSSVAVAVALWLGVVLQQPAALAPSRSRLGRAVETGAFLLKLYALHAAARWLGR